MLWMSFEAVEYFYNKCKSYKQTNVKDQPIENIY